MLVGRTGAGKSALIRELCKAREHAIMLDPDELALNYVANNTVISFFEELGVNLEPFYNLLWKHFLIVELLKEKFQIKNEESQKHYRRNIRKLLYKNDRNKELAVDYLEKWGDKFWLTSEERMKEITNRVESELKGSVGADFPALKFDATASSTLGKEEKKEIIERGRRAVSSIQIRELEQMINVLAEDVFDDRQEHFYICIDYLDEDWVDEKVKLQLVKALINTVRKFQKIPNVAIVIALRDDLLDKVMHFKRTAGFQEDKFGSLKLDVRWNKGELFRLVDTRIGYLFKRQYTKNNVVFYDVFPSKVDAKETFDYLIERTFWRPRDIILFVNYCIQSAEGRCSIAAHDIKRAEADYSRDRLNHLATEWRAIYPNLYTVCMMFNGLPGRLQLSDLTEAWISERYTEVLSDIRREACPDRLTQLLDSLFDNGNFSSVRRSIINDLYKVGFIGLKPSPSDAVLWAVGEKSTVSPPAARPSSFIYFHPMFHRALAIDVRN
jgi:hypothetical protein